MTRPALPRWLAVPATAAAVFLAVPLLAMLARVPWGRLPALLASPAARDALGLSLPQHDELELYVRVGPAHLSSELCWYYNHTPDLDQAGWKNVDGGCAEYVTEAGDLGVLVRQEHAVDAYFSALHDKNVSGPAPFLSFSHFEDGAHQYIWVYSAAAP